MRDKILTKLDESPLAEAIIYLLLVLLDNRAELGERFKKIKRKIQK